MTCAFCDPSFLKAFCSSPARVKAMTRKKTGGGLGNSLTNDRRKRGAQQAGYNASGVAEGQAQRSVLEQSSLDDFIAKAECLGRILVGRSVRSFETGASGARGLWPIASNSIQKCLKNLETPYSALQHTSTCWELTSTFAHDIT